MRNKEEIIFNAKELPFFKLDYSKFREIPKEGIVPASIIDAKTGLYLMTAYMTEEAYRKTLSLGQVVFWSRTTKEFLYKGETSGNKLIVRDIKKGCEDDILAISVDPVGPACHRNTWTCFDGISLKDISREQRFNEKGKCPYCGK